MNNKLSYEILLTEKLESRPLPDLADAIWNRIEAQLDLDLPTDDGSGAGAPKSPTISGKWWKGFGLSAFIVALVLAFLQQRSDQAPVENNFPDSINEGSLNPRESRPPDQERGVISPGTQNQQPPRSATSTPAVDDSISGQPAEPAIQPAILPPATIDSQLLRPSPPVIVPVSPPKQDTIKKNRGVKGITDDDYRIEPKKAD